MAITIKHAKTDTITDWTQADLDQQIAAGNYPPGTTLANIVLPSDWNNDHTVTGLGTIATQDANNVSITGGSVNNTSQSKTTISDYETFTGASAPSYAEGEVWYDSTAHALAYYNDSPNSTVHIGQDLQVKVINNTGSSIANGSPVYITGTSSGQTYPNVALAKADVAATSAVIGLTNGAIANGAIGYVTSQGTIDNVNTGTFTVGQVLYLSPYSAGQLMNTIPPTGITVQVGVVSYVNSSTGKIYVKQTTPLAVPASIITGTLGVANGGTGLSSLTANYVPYGNGTSAFNSSANLQFTGSNLLIGQTYDQGTGALQVTGTSTRNGNALDKNLYLQGGNNLIKYSQDLTNAVWTKTSATIGTGVTAPDGTTNANSITATSTNAQVQQVFTSVAGNTYTYQVKVQAGNISTFDLGGTNQGVTNFYARYTLTGSGSVSILSGSPTATIIALANGWYLCTITKTFTAGNSNDLISLFPGNNGATTSGNYVNVFGAQVEIGTQASNYTVTTSTALTTTNNISVPSGQVLGALGTAALPSVSVGSSNMGIFQTSGGSLGFATGGSTQAYLDSSGFYTAGLLSLGPLASLDCRLYRDSAGVLAQRNGTNAQTTRIYNTYTDASNYERFSISWSANQLNIANEAAGTGTLRKISFTNDLTVNTLTVGLGGGAISTNTAVGYTAINSTSNGGSNTAVGYQALKVNVNGTNNVALGANSLTTNSSGTGNIGIGYNALTNNLSASQNIAIGTQALQNNSTGASNIAIGWQSLLNTSNSNNTAIGYASLQNNSTSSNNTALGYASLQYNTIGANQVAVGYQALTNNTTASNLTALGYQSLFNNTTNVATLGAITGGTGYTNGTYTGVVMTLSSGSTMTTYPTATIVVSGGAVTSVTLTANGVGAKDTTTVLTAPAASIGGTGSGFSVPVASLTTPGQNTAVGYQAFYTNATGSDNTGLGYQTGYFTTGGGNSALGRQALYTNTTGANNTALGAYSLYTNSTGQQNVGVGYYALNLATGSFNTAVGYTALSSTSTGTNNIGLGRQAGQGNASANANTTGSNNTYIGYQTVGSANNNTNEMVIGYTAVGLGSNTTVIGNSSTTLTKTFGVHVTSGYTVATLPAGTTGARAYVTDALAPTFLGALTGGGAITTPVFYNGTAWVAG